MIGRDLAVGDHVYRVYFGPNGPEVQVAVVKKITERTVVLRGRSEEYTPLAFGCGRVFPLETEFFTNPEEAISVAIARQMTRIDDAKSDLLKLEGLRVK